jgi:hypothetical protein
LNTIEGILNKYKISINEQQQPQTAAQQMKQWRALMELTQADMDAAAAKRRTAQSANQSAIDARFAADAQAKKIGPYYSDTPAQAMPYSQAAQQSGAARSAEQGAARAGAEAGERVAAKAAGKAVGKFIVPGIGTTLSAYDAYNRWQSGDKSGAVIAALAGAGWLIPGPLGWAIGGGLDAANLARDYNKRVPISDADAKIIRENLPVIISWQSDPENAKNPPPGVQEEITRVLKALKGVGIEAAGSAATQTGTKYQATFDKANAIVDKIKNLDPKILNPKDPAFDPKAVANLLDQITSLYASEIGAEGQQDPAVAKQMDAVFAAAKAAGDAKYAEAEGKGKPATGPDQNTQSVTANIPALNKALDNMDQLLKKNNFESLVRKNLVRDIHLLSESEQMALRRNLLREDWSWSDLLPDLTVGNVLAGSWLYNKGRMHGSAAEQAAQAARDARAAAGGAGAAGAAAPAGAAGAEAAAPSFYNSLKAGLSRVASMAKTGGKYGLALTAGAAAVVVGKVIYDWAMANPQAAQAAGISTTDLQRYGEISAQLTELMPKTDAEFQALPPDVQEKIKAITVRMAKMSDQIIKAAAAQHQ